MLMTNCYFNVNYISLTGNYHDLEKSILIDMWWFQQWFFGGPALSRGNPPSRKNISPLFLIYSQLLFYNFILLWKGRSLYKKSFGGRFNNCAAKNTSTGGKSWYPVLLDQVETRVTSDSQLSLIWGLGWAW
jgi:hypothetical protein